VRHTDSGFAEKPHVEETSQSQSQSPIITVGAQLVPKRKYN